MSESTVTENINAFLNELDQFEAREAREAVVHPEQLLAMVDDVNEFNQLAVGSDVKNLYIFVMNFFVFFFRSEHESIMSLILCSHQRSTVPLTVTTTLGYGTPDQNFLP